MVAVVWPLTESFALVACPSFEGDFGRLSGHTTPCVCKKRIMTSGDERG